MPIKDLQIQMRELGRLRMGEQRTSAGGKKFPAKLSTWRITTPARRLADAIADTYGGTVTPWENPKRPGKQWQVTTDSSVLKVMVPPGDVGSQWYETWSADGCLRRCDGEQDTVTGNDCDCPADLDVRTERAKKGKACKPMTRLSVMLPDIPEVGLWGLQSGGWNAAKEMAAIGKVCELATQSGRMVPAELRLEQRTVKKPGEKPSHFVVPVLEPGYSLEAIMTAVGIADEQFPQLVAPARPLALPSRPDLPADPGFKGEGSGETAALPPAPPVPGPPPEIANLDSDGGNPSSTPDDDDIAEAEIVGDGEAEAAATAEAIELPATAEEERTSTPDESDWSAKTWLAEAKKRGVPQRQLILQARQIAVDSGVDFVPSKAADLVHPDIAPGLRIWLAMQ